MVKTTVKKFLMRDHLLPLLILLLPTCPATYHLLTRTCLTPTCPKRGGWEHNDNEPLPPSCSQSWIRTFSGRLPKPNGEVDYDTWRIQVELLLCDPSLSENLKVRRVLESLLSPAAGIVKSLGTSVSLHVPSGLSNKNADGLSRWPNGPQREDDAFLREKERIEGFKTQVMDNDPKVISSEVVTAVCQYHCGHTDPGEPQHSILAESLTLDASVRC